MLVFIACRWLEDQFLEWKVWIFCVSAVLGLAGIYFAERWMTGTAIVLLVGGIALRFVAGHYDSRNHEAEESEGDESDSGAG